MNRKDDHLFLAKQSTASHNSFDDMIINHHASIPKYNLDEINITTHVCGFELTTPFFINAITGGSDYAKQINQKLANIAEKCQIAMATGSFSPALKNAEYIDDFLYIHNKNIISMTNIGADKSFAAMQQALSYTNANILQIHLNTLQELLMDEGDHNFSDWSNNITTAITKLNTPIIVKEVGFGMSKETIQSLINLGVKTIDISGKGGTNFAYIENSRNNNPIEYLNNWGISTVNSLINSIPYQSQCDFIASGGIRNALDIVKCFILGAKAVGISQTFLNWVVEYDEHVVIEKVEQLKHEIKKIMCLLNCKCLSELKNIDYYLINNTLQYKLQITEK